MRQMNWAQALPLKIRANAFIKVSGVRVAREANISDSGKQVWALIQRRTAFLCRNKDKKNFHISNFWLIDSMGENDPSGSDSSVNFYPGPTLMISITCICWHGGTEQSSLQLLCRLLPPSLPLPCRCHPPPPVAAAPSLHHLWAPALSWQ